MKEKGGGKRKLFFTLVSIGVILLAGVIPRIIYLMELRENPSYLGPGIDAAYHHYWAGGLATGKWSVPAGRDDPEIWRHPFYRPPGYPYFLSVIYRLAGMGPLTPRLFQSVLGLAAVLAAWWISRSWFGETAGFFAGLLMATYWIFIYFEGELLGVSITVLLSCFLLLTLSKAARRSSPVLGLTAGLLLGVYMLFRPNIALFLPVALVWLLVAIRGCLLSRKLLISGLIVLGTILPLIPVASRNYVVSGELVPLGTNLGISIGVANNPYSDGTTHTIPEIGEIGTPFDWPRIVRGMERRRNLEPGSLAHRAASGILVKQSLSWIKEDPYGFLSLLGRKAKFFWGPREVRNIRELELERLDSPVLSFLPMSWSWVLALAVIGMVSLFAGTERGNPRRRYGILAGLFILTYFFSIWPFAVAGRYRVPVIPAMLILGSIVPARFLVLFRKRYFTRLVLWIAAVVILVILFSLDFTSYEVAPEKWHNDRGIAYFAAENYPSAIHEFREALLVSPGYAAALTNLGVTQHKMGDISGAIESYRKALKFKSSARTHRNLAQAFQAADRRDEAIEQYKLALERDPAYTQVRVEYARALEEAGRFEDAAEQYQHILSSRPDDTGSRNAMGIVMVKMGKNMEALREFEKVLATDPSDNIARHNCEEIIKLLGEPAR